MHVAQLMLRCHSLSLSSVKSTLVLPFLVTAHPGSPGQNPEGRETVVVVVVVVALHVVVAFSFVLFA